MPVTTLTSVAANTKAGLFPGPANYPGPAAYPGRGITLSSKAA